MDIQKSFDEYFMSEAIHLATRGMGKTSPNPMVGAVITRNNRIIGRGYHRRYGEAHAETVALIDARYQTADATLYTNLEPCIHYGKTPPCAEAILRAGIKRVVVSMLDPNPAVAGKGVAFLRKNNIKVDIGLMCQESSELNRAYIKFIKTGKPYIILKIASTLNGMISLPDVLRRKKYITSLESRRLVHSLRGYVDAILVGVNTVIKDNPYLTNRLAGGSNPARIILDANLKTPLSSRVLRPDGTVFIICRKNISRKRIAEFKARGVKIIHAPVVAGKIKLNSLLNRIVREGITSILVEGGAKIFASFLNQNLYDEIYLFIAPRIIGRGKNYGDTLTKIIALNNLTVKKIGEDYLFKYVHRNN